MDSFSCESLVESKNLILKFLIANGQLFIVQECVNKLIVSYEIRKFLFLV